MIAYGGAEAQFQLFLTLTYEYKWSASRQNHCTSLHLTGMEDPPVTPE
jgi:hypothetical protein